MSLKPRSVHRKYWFLRVLPHKMAFFNDNPGFRNFVCHEYCPLQGFTDTACQLFTHSLRAVPASRAHVGRPAFSRPQTTGTATDFGNLCGHLYECGADEGVASSTSPSADPNSVCQPKKKRRDVVCDPNVSQIHRDCVWLVQTLIVCQALAALQPLAKHDSHQRSTHYHFGFLSESAKRQFQQCSPEVVSLSQARLSRRLGQWPCDQNHVLEGKFTT